LPFEKGFIWKVYETPQLSRDNWERTQVEWNLKMLRGN
jgi:hypothetical protein